MTPFLLAGATAPVSVAAGLSLQVAEALSGVADRAGDPAGRAVPLRLVLLRASTCAAAAPALGMPESVLGTLAGGQLARHYGLPYRGGGGLCAGQAMDAQAATETAMSLWATMLAGSRPRAPRCGWLEGGLTASYEKFALDLEVLRMFRDRRRRVRGRRRAARARRRCATRARAAMFLAATTRSSPLPRVVVHEPAVPLAGVSDVGEAGRADRRRARDEGVEALLAS